MDIAWEESNTGTNGSRRRRRRCRPFQLTAIHAFVIVVVVPHVFITLGVAILVPARIQMRRLARSRIPARHRIACAQFFELRVGVKVVAERRDHVAGEDTEDISLVLCELWRSLSAKWRKVLSLEGGNASQAQMS